MGNTLTHTNTSHYIAAIFNFIAKIYNPCALAAGDSRIAFGPYFAVCELFELPTTLCVCGVCVRGHCV